MRMDYGIAVTFNGAEIGVISDVHIQVMATDPDKTLKFALNKLKE